MEQTKNEPTKENKAAPDTGKPKKEREPLTEAQRLKRQKMIVLPICNKWKAKGKLDTIVDIAQRDGWQRNARILGRC